MKIISPLYRLRAFVIASQDLRKPIGFSVKERRTRYSARKF